MTRLIGSLPTSVIPRLPSAFPSEPVERSWSVTALVPDHGVSVICVLNTICAAETGVGGSPPARASGYVRAVRTRPGSRCSIPPRSQVANSLVTVRVRWLAPPVATRPPEASTVRHLGRRGRRHQAMQPGRSRCASSPISSSGTPPLYCGISVEYRSALEPWPISWFLRQKVYSQYFHKGVQPRRNLASEKLPLLSVAFDVPRLPKHSLQTLPCVAALARRKRTDHLQSHAVRKFLPTQLGVREPEIEPLGL